jgi:type I site-specific restriction endonuclease
MTPEQKARVSIDALLQQAGWHVCNVADANLPRAKARRPASLAKAFAANS